MNNEWFKKAMDWLLEKGSGKKWYKTRIVWIAAVTVIILIMLLNPKDGKKENNNLGKYEIPNVFGVYYEDAASVLEAEGFEVKTVETSVGGISDKLLYPLGRVEAGAVFKIDDYILDGHGNFTVNYELDYDLDCMRSKYKSVVLYYAKEDYSRKEVTPEASPDSENVNETVENAEVNEAPVTENKQEVNNTVAEKPVEETPTEEPASNVIRANFKSAMDSYEKFFDEYVAIMKKYANNPEDLSILGDYAKYMSKYAQMMSDFEKWENEDMNAAETAYYIEVQGRITKKLLEVA